jgi:hypothetical protein
MTKTLTRLFDTYPEAESAVAELERMGVPHSDISIVANNADGAHGAHNHDAHTGHLDQDGDVSRGVGAGAALGGAGGLLAGLGLLAIPGLGPVVAAGWLLATAAGASIGAIGGGATGGIVGALRNAGHTDEEAHVYSEGVRRGGTLVSAKVPDDMADAAAAAFNRFNAVDATTRGADYRATGWSSFDDQAPHYDAGQIAAERNRTARM